MKIKMGFRTKMILAFVLVITIPIVVLGAIVYNITTDSYYESLKGSSLEISNQINTSVSNYMAIYGRATSLAALDPNLRSGRTNPENITWMLRTFDSFVTEYSVVRNIYVGYKDQAFHIYPHVDLPADYDPRTRPWYTEAVEKDDLIWTSPYEDASEEGAIVISAAKPVYGPSGFEGVVAIDLDISEIAILANRVRIGENGYIVMLDSNDVIFTHPDASLVGQEIPVDSLKAFVENNSEGEFEYKYNGVNRIAILSTIDGLGWKILATVDEREIYEQTRTLMISIVGFGSVLLAIAIAVAVIFSNAMLKNIRNISEAISLMSRGDLRTSVKVNTKDEFGKLADDLNHMVNSISSLIGNVSRATKDVLSSSTELVDLSDRASMAAREVSSAVEEVATGATRQATDSEHSSRVAEQMGNNIKTLTDNVISMIEMAKEASAINEESVKAVHVLRTKNTENNEATLKTETAILELEKQSIDIGSFVQTISTIAEQTNLLALNASIEAARAGEHGRGFAVVADEIRKLAEESSKAADEIKSIVVNIQSGSKNTVNIMQEVKSRSTEQNDAVQRVEESFQSIFKSINNIQGVINVVSKDIEVLDVSKIEILDSIASIASVSEEAAAASEEVSASMQEQTAVVEQVASSADQLKDLATDLEVNINQFKI